MVNITLNLSEIANFSFVSRESPCFVNGALKADCIIRQFCPQVSGYFASAALMLVIAYLLVNDILPLFFARILPRLGLRRFYQRFPKLPDIRLPAIQEALLAWLKARLAWASVVFCAYCAFTFM